MKKSKADLENEVLRLEAQEKELIAIVRKLRQYLVTLRTAVLRRDDYTLETSTLCAEGYLSDLPDYIQTQIVP